MKPSSASDDKSQLFNAYIPKLLRSFGENENREGLLETPRRVQKMYEELLKGYKENPADIMKTFPGNGYKDLISVTNIEFYSLCEHHMVPFFGRVHIGYVPNKRILGLSKFGRLVEIYSRRLQTQENLTKEIFDAVKNHLHPKGCVVSIEAEHMCVSMRGVKKPGFMTKTCVSDKIIRNKKGAMEQFYRDIDRES